ncbi:MAG: glutathione S-transferase family protein [Gallionellaceae bacterium]|jgi:glutathione S-transferase
MNSIPKLELISFDLCPYVQRSVITLIEKNMDYKITYIDLANPPDWFMKISPLGKVPVLRAGGAIIFESAVINEYIDEISPPPLLPADPLARAINRAWIEFASGMLVSQYQMMTSKDKQGFEQKGQEIRDKLAQIEAQLSSAGAFFNGTKFSLLDAAIAPMFMRLDILEQQILTNKYITTPRLAAWRDAMLSRPSVQKSVIPDFSNKLVSYLRHNNNYIASLL